MRPTRAMSTSPSLNGGHFHRVSSSRPVLRSRMRATSTTCARVTVQQRGPQLENRQKANFRPILSPNRVFDTPLCGAFLERRLRTSHVSNVRSGGSGGRSEACRAARSEGRRACEPDRATARHASRRPELPERRQPAYEGQDRRAMPKAKPNYYRRYWLKAILQF